MGPTSTLLVCLYILQSLTLLLLLLLGGSWVVINGVKSRVTIVISPIRGRITLLIPTHEPSSPVLSYLVRESCRGIWVVPRWVQVEHPSPRF